MGYIQNTINKQKRGKKVKGKVMGYITYTNKNKCFSFKGELLV